MTSSPTQDKSSPVIASASPTPVAVSTPQILWAFQTGSAIWGTATVNNGTVYTGSDDGTLYAINAQTGALNWKFLSNGIIRSQPALSTGLVYFASDDGYLYAIDEQNGQLVWQTDIGNALPCEVREKLGTNTSPTGWDYKQSSPVVMDKRVYVGSLDGNVYALDSTTGKAIWTYQTGGKVRATPVINDSGLYIGSWDESFYALDLKTGNLRWNTPVGGEVQSTALAANGLIYTASRKASIVALDSQTGDLSWEFNYGTNMWVESSPVLSKEVLYIGSAGSKWVVGLDGLTGKMTASFYSKTYYMGTPAIHGDALLIGGVTFRQEDKGGLFMFKLSNKSFPNSLLPDQFFPVDKTLESEGNWSGVLSTPVIQDGITYIGGLDGKLYALILDI